MLSQLFRLLPNFLRRRLERLRFPQLAVVTGLLFLITLFVPDPLPFVDELLLLAGTLLLGSWKHRREERAPTAGKPPIDGEARRVDPR
jgi:hypothetical protein